MKKSDQVFNALSESIQRALKSGVELGTHDIGVFEIHEVYCHDSNLMSTCCAIGCHLIGKKGSGDWMKDAAKELDISEEEVGLITRGFDMGPSEISKNEYFWVGAMLRTCFMLL